MTTTVEKPAGVAPVEPERARRQRGDSFLVTVLAVVVALVLGGLLMIFTDPGVQSTLGYFFAAPGDFFSSSWHVVAQAYEAMFSGAVFDIHNDGTLAGVLGPLGNTAQSAAPLICAGLGISLAFRSGLFNIGGEGQIVLGAFCSGYIGFEFHLPVVIHLIVAIVAGILGGAIWGWIAGYLKARTGAHEVITTIMLNYVALFGLKYLLSLSSIQQPGNPQASKVIDSNAQLPHLLGNSLNFDLGIVLAIAAAAVVWWLMSRSTVGFRLRAVGANPAAARTAGMSVSGSTIQAMVLAGALAGLAGTIMALGGTTSYQITPGISSNFGFDAITVALLGRTKPWGTVWAGLLLGGLKAGGRTMQAVTASAASGSVGGVPIDIVTVIEALIVIFIAAPRLIRALFRLKGRYGSMLTGAVTNLAVQISTVRKVRVPKHVFAGVLQAVLGVAAVLVFGLSSRVGQHSDLQFSLPGAAVNLGNWSFPARPVVLVLCLATVVIGGLRAGRILGARWAASLSIFCLVVAFMVWAVAGSPSGVNVVSLLQGALFPSAIPLILGALAGVMGERSGVVNVALEGQLLLGAFVAAVAATMAGSVWAGVLGGALAGVLLAALLAVFAIRYLVDQVIVGVVLNLFALGITNFLYQKLLANNPQQYNSPGYFSRIKIPVLGDIPIIGPVLFDGTIFLYLTYVLVIVVHFGLFHTRWGLRLRAVGEHPKAADTVGINVYRTRYRAVLLAGVVAGLAGAFMVVGTGSTNTFVENMSSGKGFIALAAVIFGRWTPVGAVAAALLFGFADQLQSLLSQAGAPIDANLLLTAPYIATIFAVAGVVGRVRAPAADGQPYILE
jgi:simple sugar transport system permease protein